MAIKGAQLLYNLILKDVVKRSGKASGILSIGSDVRKIAMNKYAKIVDDAKRQGVDLDKLSEQEIKYMMELNKPKAPKVLSNEDAVAFLNQFLKQGKKGEVVKFPKDKITDWTKARPQPPETEIIDGIQTTRGLGDLFPKQLEKTVTVRTVIEDIKKLEPIESMKEANRVLRGEGKYKNLSKADREKIVGDESVTDHIFERNIEPDPEDFAQGGRIGYFGGAIVDPEGHNITRREMGILANADPSMREMIRGFLTSRKKHKFVYPDRILDINRGRRTGEASGGRVPFDGGGSADQRMREAMAQMIMTKVPGIPESDIQIIVKDINIGMSPEDAQASVKANFLKLYGMAEGGRVPLAGGAIVKGGKWFIKSLTDTREQLKTMRLSPGQLKRYLEQIDDQIADIKAGGKIPDEVIQTIRKDPKFKSVWQNQKSADPDLREMEEVLLEYGKKHASGGIARMIGE